MNLRRAVVLLAVAALARIAVAAPESARAQTPEAATVAVDATDAPRGIFHTRLTIPAKPGPLTLLYPQWIPGEHGPTGPILQMMGLRISSNGAELAWTRDPADNFTFHVNVPAGASSVDAAFDFVSPSLTSGFSGGASTSEMLAVLSWNSVVLYPAGVPSDRLGYKASLEIPAGWQYATALRASGTSGNTVSFDPASLTTLVDSPVLMGRHFRIIPLTSGGDIPMHRIAIAADSEAALAMPDAMVDEYKRLVHQTLALFGAHHYRDYTFLVTLSDQVAHFGLEHHESSDDRTRERSLVDDDLRLNFSSLLPHEFVHSWNGKYRRPAGLATPEYQSPMQDDLLWVYEGLTEYLSYVLTARSGLQTPEQIRDSIAHVAAVLDNKSGRTWRPLQDTATMAAQLYNGSGEWSNYRRGVDFYDEGVLVWLEVDTIIRQQSGGSKSIEDFCRAFYGPPSTGPVVKPYTMDDVVAALQSVAPYDWKTLLRTRLDAKDAHAPMSGLAESGWQLVYNGTPNVVEKASGASGKGLDLTYAGGLSIDESGRVEDVVHGAEADRAGLAPGMVVVAVNGRQYSPDVMHDALVAAKGSKEPIALIVRNGEFYRTAALDYHGGERFPHLERIAGKPDLLGKILAPLP